jgi:hypothetical protein
MQTEWLRSRRQPTIEIQQARHRTECRTSSLKKRHRPLDSRLKERVAPMSSHMLIGEAWDRGSMTKYRVDIFKPSRKLAIPLRCCGDDATFSLLTMLPRQPRPRIGIALTQLSGPNELIPLRQCRKITGVLAGGAVAVAVPGTKEPIWLRAAPPPNPPRPQNRQPIGEVVL